MSDLWILYPHKVDHDVNDIDDENKTNQNSSISLVSVGTDCNQKQRLNWSEPIGPLRPVIEEHGTAAVDHSLRGWDKGRWPFCILCVCSQRDFNLESVPFASMFWPGSDDTAVMAGVLLHVKACLQSRQRLFHIETLWDRFQQTTTQVHVDRQTDRQTVCPSCLAHCSVQGHSCHCLPECLHV